MRRRLPTLFLLCLPAVLPAAPYTPTDDAQVVERVPARASDPRAKELHALRQQLRRSPQDLDLAVRFAQRCYEEVAAQGDPRYIGYAQAALQPWLGLADPPPAVRVLRAILLQFDHRFEPALQDLAAVLRVEPDHVEAGAWRTAILMVRADYAGARASCRQMAPHPRRWAPPPAWRRWMPPPAAPPRPPRRCAPPCSPTRRPARRNACGA
ncbi:MAG: hypothetical protein IPI08_05600 [Betaproteobacteria bacterium]|nr:hypothetical protein [Betaproteobacteria bacterium]